MKSKPSTWCLSVTFSLVFCDVTVLADAGLHLWSGSTGANASNMTAVDLTARGVTVNKHFLKVTYSPFKDCTEHLSKCYCCCFPYLKIVVCLIIYKSNLTWLIIYDIPEFSFNATILNIIDAEKMVEKAWKKEIRVGNHIFYCYVLPITTNSISSVHFNLHKYIEKQRGQRVTDSHDNRNTSMHGQHRGIDTVHGESYAVISVWGSGIVNETSTTTLFIITSSV